MNKEITDKITGIIKDAEDRRGNYDLQKDHSLSKSYPEGEKAYFKMRIFELKQQIARDTMIGQHWIENYCSNDILINDWINKHTQIALKWINESEVWEQLRTFMYQYFWLQNLEGALSDLTSLEPIIAIEQINSIYMNYKEYINEPLLSWSERFIYNGQPVNPLKLEPKVTKGSSRLVTLAILAAIQPKTGAAFDFNDFVLDRFGIKNFEKAKSDHKEKQEYTKVFENCEAILMK